MMLRFICSIPFFAFLILRACIGMIRFDYYKHFYVSSSSLHIHTQYAYSYVYSRSCTNHRIISAISQPQRFIFWALNGICALLSICSLSTLILLSITCVWLHASMCAHGRVNFRDISISFQLEIFIKSKRLAIITETLLYPVVSEWVWACVCVV